MVKLKISTISDLQDFLKESNTCEVYARPESGKTLDQVIQENSKGMKFKIFTLIEDNIVNSTPQIVGYCVAIDHPEYDIQLGPMYIAKEFRGKGYGKIMVQLFIEWAIVETYKTIYAKAGKLNVPLQHIFENLNFQKLTESNNDLMQEPLEYLLKV